MSRKFICQRRRRCTSQRFLFLLSLPEQEITCAMPFIKCCRTTPPDNGRTRVCNVIRSPLRLNGYKGNYGLILINAGPTFPPLAGSPFGASIACQRDWKKEEGRNGKERRAPSSPQNANEKPNVTFLTLPLRARAGRDPHPGVLAVHHRGVLGHFLLRHHRPLRHRICQRTLHANQRGLSRRPGHGHVGGLLRQRLRRPRQSRGQRRHGLGPSGFAASRRTLHLRAMRRRRGRSGSRPRRQGTDTHAIPSYNLYHPPLFAKCKRISNAVPNPRKKSRGRVLPLFWEGREGSPWFGGIK